MSLKLTTPTRSTAWSPVSGVINRWQLSGHANASSRSLRYGTGPRTSCFYDRQRQNSVSLEKEVNHPPVAIILAGLDGSKSITSHTGCSQTLVRAPESWVVVPLVADRFGAGPGWPRRHILYLVTMHTTGLTVHFPKKTCSSNAARRGPWILLLNQKAPERTPAVPARLIVV